MAKKFKFKLEPVLRYRERIEEDVKNRFAHIQSVRNQKQSELDSVREDARQARLNMDHAKLGDIDISKLRMLNRYITGLNVSELQRTGELRVIDVEVEKRRLEFVAARQQTKVMTNLKERRLEEHLYEEGQEETRLFDEMAVQRVVANRRNLMRLQELSEKAREAEG